MDSLNHDFAIAFQDYVRTFADELFTEQFYGFKTSDLATTYEGVKGEHVITSLEIGDNLARRWGRGFNPLPDIATPKPRVLKTVLNKVDFSIVPQEYEFSYLGQLRKKGQNPEDWPLSAYIMEKVMAKMKQEFEVALWQGQAAAVPSPDDFLRQTFDGYLKIVTDALASGAITAVATGASTSADIIADLRLMWAQVGSPYQENGTDIFMSYALYDIYRIAYKDAYKIDPAYIQITEAGYQGIQFELGSGNTRIIPINGMAGSGRIIITPRENLVIGIDSPSDTQFRVQADIRELKFAQDFRMGAQILLQKNGVLVVNDQA